MSFSRASRRVLRRVIRARIVVSLTFDDGTADHLEAARLLSDRTLCGTFYVNSGRIGAPGRLDWSQLAEIAAAGHEVGGHTADHVDLVRSAPGEAARQVEEDRRLLIERGHDVRSFAYPYGAHDDAARRVVADAGYTSGRRAWGLVFGDDRTHPATESVPPRDPYAIRTVPSFANGTRASDMQEAVLRAEAAGGWLPLVFHGVSGGAGDYEVDRDTFSAFLDWLASRRRVRVETVSAAAKAQS